ncbi:MAG: gsiA 4 [Microvirga sp.]|jgi:peptide/nickel transport system ATP-binding protein|nr:gsiA 4 [Microvirga sp.]
MTGAELVIQDLRIGYKAGPGVIPVLNGVDLRIEPSEVLGLVGESGSGKSTLAYSIVRHLGRKAHIASGSIRVDEEDILFAGFDRLREIRQNVVSMVYQDPAASLNPTMSLGRQLLESIRQRNGSSESNNLRIAHDLLARVNLPDPPSIMNRYPHQVSGGEKQRILIAMAFAANPRLMICDEPTTALDATTAAQVLDLLRDLTKETGTSVLFISHDLGTISEIADRVAVIYSGHIVEVGNVKDVLRSPAHPYTQNLLASAVNSGLQPVRRRILTRGNSPDSEILKPAGGCVYYDRCAFRTEECRTASMELISTPNREIACIHHDRETQARAPLSAPEASTKRDGDTLLELRRLSIHYGRRLFLDRFREKPRQRFEAVAAINLSIRSGETIGLVGESGCGKSTLAKAIAGLVDFEGEIAFDGRSFSSTRALDAQYRRDVQIIFQHPDAALNPKKTIRQILGRPASVRDGIARSELRARVAELLEMVRLPKHYAGRHPHELSGGEKQRVCIARAFAARPKLIICDEITSGLDVSVQGTILNLLADLQDQNGISYIFISHDLNVVQHIADRIAVMYLGRVIEMRGTSSLSAPYHPYTEALFSAMPSLDATIKTRRIRLSGARPDPRNPPLGCSLELRCPRRIGDICARNRPELRRVGDSHLVSCHIPTAELLATPSLWNPIEQVTKVAPDVE